MVRGVIGPLASIVEVLCVSSRPREARGEVLCSHSAAERSEILGIRKVVGVVQEGKGRDSDEHAGGLG